MRNVRPYAAYFVEHAHLFPMNVRAVCLILCARDAKAAPITDFWTVRSVTMLRAVMSAGSFLAQN